jgi:predicted amidohydrolase
MQLEKNFAKAADFIRAASRQHAELAVLPEYHLLNWVPQDPKFKEACGQWEKYLNKYRDLAKECNICIVPGTIVELHGEGTDDERLENVAYFIANTGEIAGKYVKKNLWGPIERLHLTSSSRDEHPVFDTPMGRVGMLICWDLAFPEAFREMIAQGAKIIIIPTFWTLSDCSPAGLAINPVAEGLFLDSMLTARCFENTCGEYTIISSTRIACLQGCSDYFCQCRRTSRQRIRRSLTGLRAVRRSTCASGQWC